MSVSNSYIFISTVNFYNILCINNDCFQEYFLVYLFWTQIKLIDPPHKVIGSKEGFKTIFIGDDLSTLLVITIDTKNIAINIKLFFF